MTATPSYGRDYKSADAALKDWYASKDFTIASIDGLIGAQCSIRDNIPSVTIRYNKLRYSVIVPTTSETIDAMCETDR